MPPEFEHAVCRLCADTQQMAVFDALNAVRMCGWNLIPKARLLPRCRTRTLEYLREVAEANGRTGARTHTHDYTDTTTGFAVQTFPRASMTGTTRPLLHTHLSAHPHMPTHDYARLHTHARARYI